MRSIDAVQPSIKGTLQKAVEVFHSCRTPEQWRTAANYGRLVLRVWQSEGPAAHKAAEDLLVDVGISTWDRCNGVSAP